MPRVSGAPVVGRLPLVAVRLVERAALREGGVGLPRLRGEVGITVVERDRRAS